MKSIVAISVLLTFFAFPFVANAEKAENLGSIWITGMPSEAGCSAPACLTGCDYFSGIAVHWDYYTTEGPVSYTTWVQMYEDDPTMNDPLTDGYWSGSVSYSYGWTYNSSHTYGYLFIGAETCVDVGDGEFFATVHVNSYLVDEEGDSPIYYVTDTSAVELSSFEAFSAEDGVDVFWTTSLEIDNAGWNIYRSTSENGFFEKLNEEIILPYQYFYNFYDDEVEIGETYLYRLENIALSGKMEWHGPVSVTVMSQEDSSEDDSSLEGQDNSNDDDSSSDETDADFVEDRDSGCGF